jgi:hypothetical protein
MDQFLVHLLIFQVNNSNMFTDFLNVNFKCIDIAIKKLSINKCHTITIFCCVFFFFLLASYFSLMHQFITYLQLFEIFCISVVALNSIVSSRLLKFNYTYIEFRSKIMFSHYKTKSENNTKT